MALIAPGETECPLCGNPIEAEQPVVASQFVGAYGEHDLSLFYDAAMHQSCFVEWELRDEFVRQHDSNAPYEIDPEGNCPETAPC